MEEKFLNVKLPMRNFLKINLEYSNTELSTMTNFEREAFPPNLVPHMSNVHVPVFFSTGGVNASQVSCFICVRPTLEKALTVFHYFQPKYSSYEI